MTRTRGLGLTAIALLLPCSAAWAMFMPAPEVPVERLIKNVGAYVQANPTDPQGYYLLGRINALAFDRRSRTVRAYEQKGGKLPALAPYQSAGRRTEKPLTVAETAKFFREAVANYEKAIRLKPAEGLYELGLAWVLERGAQFAGTHKDAAATQPATKPAGVDQSKVKSLILQLDDKKFAVREAAEKALMVLMPAAESLVAEAREGASAEAGERIGRILASPYVERAIKHYQRAYELAIGKDLKAKSRGPLGSVGFEAGQSWLRLAGGRGIQPAETALKAKIEADIKAIQKKPQFVTPIVFSLKAHRRGLKGLIAPDAAVAFDLDGSGRRQRWQWVKPETGILVWDPNGRGKITSGRQLFGSVTWWMFWRNGYHALDALDDDRNGRLEGKELRGLAAWFDRNGNGISDRGEVVPLKPLGIRALAVRSTGKTPDGSPWNPTGLTLRDGRKLPTYDWIARPANGT